MSNQYHSATPALSHKNLRHRNFTIRHFKSTITRYVESGYQFVRFSDVLGAHNLPRKMVILRHDIDVDPAIARKMFDAEIELGIRSNVFVRTNAQTYNIDEVGSANLISFLKNHDFEIGIHLDISLDREAPNTPFDQQVARFAKASGISTFGMSTHKPAQLGNRLITATAKKLGLTYEAYNKQFTTEFKYISDSSRHWREGCFCQWINVVDRLQILIHPVWWRRGSAKIVDWVNNSI